MTHYHTHTHTQIRCRAVFRKLREVWLISKYEAQLQEAERFKKEVTKSYWATLQSIEEKESVLRQSLLTAQSSLNTQEMQVEQLRKELEVQLKTKQLLVQWKVKNVQMLEELETKVKKYERWSTVDVDAMLTELEEKNRDLERLQGVEQKFAKNSDALDNQREKVFLLCVLFVNLSIFT